MIQEHTPLTWLQTAAVNLGWIPVVAAAYVLGRVHMRLEMRINKAEENIKLMVDRHLPAIHRALSEIRGLLMGGR